MVFEGESEFSLNFKQGPVTPLMWFEPHCASQSSIIHHTGSQVGLIYHPPPRDIHTKKCNDITIWICLHQWPIIVCKALCKVFWNLYIYDKFDICSSINLWMSTRDTIYEPISRQMKRLLKLSFQKTLKISAQLLIFLYSLGKFLIESNTLHGF